jgi:hypothetical protein
MFKPHLRSFVSTPSCLAIAIALIVSTPALAQTVTVPQQPLSDIDCPPGTQIYLIGTTCTTTGTRTATPTTGTVTPQAGGGVRVDGQWNVTYVGNLQTDGIPFSTVPGQPFNFDATTFYDPTAVTVNVNASYTGGYNNLLLPTFDINNPGYFQTYTNQTTTVNSLNVNITDGTFTDANTSEEYAFNLNSPSPTAIQNGNSVALTGSYRQTNGNAIVFGALGGTATLQAAGATSAAQFGIANGSWGSPYRLQYAVTPIETTRLDQNGLTTPTVSVTDGINLNGSKVTGLGAGTVTTDAVNLGQLNAAVAGVAAGVNPYVKVNSAGVAANASGTEAIAIGVGATASGASGVAIGREAQATTGAVALGGDGGDLNNNFPGSASAGAIAAGLFSTALGSDALASANSSTAIGSQASATGGQSTASGYASTASGSQSNAMGTFSVASGVQSTAIGVNSLASGRGATALGNNTKAWGDPLAATPPDTYSTAVGFAASAGGDASYNPGALNATSVGAFSKATQLNRRQLEEAP